MTYADKILPHKFTRESDGWTFYYSGQGMYPLYCVKPCGEGYWGFAVDRTPANERLICEADKRVYVSRKTHN